MVPSDSRVDQAAAPVEPASPFVLLEHPQAETLGTERLHDIEEQQTIRGTRDDNLLDIDHRATLNDALDTMLTSSHRGAIVTGRPPAKRCSA